jgi:hypothetical protein
MTRAGQFELIGIIVVLCMIQHSRLVGKQKVAGSSTVLRTNES